MKEPLSGAPIDQIEIRRSPTGEIIRGECRICGEIFYTSLDPITDEAQLYEQHKEHMLKKHGPFDI